MSMNQARREYGGLIDRNKPLNFTFNGKAYSGYEGDTLASALIANDVMLTARSFRYHRPRGIFSAGIEECHALVCVGEDNRREPNVRATQQLLYEGLVASSQNVWPSVKWDLGALTGWLSRFLPTGFYYKTFIWPHWKWYEGLVRRLAGIAPAPEGKDPDRYDKQHAHCDLLIIGGGPSGLAAALSAANSGLRIILVDDQPRFGGSLLWDQSQVEEKAGTDWAHGAIHQLSEMDNITLLSHTTVIAAWDHAYFTAVQHRHNDESGQIAQRLWKIRSRQTILATGAIERPLVFPDNDRPGIMLADSARQYVNRYAARPGNRAVIYTNNDSAYQAALDLHACGITVAAVIDVRDKVLGELPRRIRALGISVYGGHEIVVTRGYFGIRHVELRPDTNHRGDQTGRIRLECDLLCISGGWDPGLRLLSQAGGKLDFDEQLNCFVPRENQPAQAHFFQAAGSANGCFDLATCLVRGHEAGLEAVERLIDEQLSGERPANGTAPTAADSVPAQSTKPHWQSKPPCKGRQWVDHLHDVTSKSIETAAREGFFSVEHLKRYTTTGMAIDQGKTANVNALAILGESSGRPVNDVSTTTFRPPFTPVTLGALAGREVGPRAWPRRLLPLHDWHVEAGGVMEDHSGWQRAAYYPRDGESEARAAESPCLTAHRWASWKSGDPMPPVS